MFDWNDAVRWLVNALVFLAAWQLAVSRPEASRRISRFVPMLLGFLWGALIVTGIQRRDSAAELVVQWHLGAGNAAVIVAWCGTIFAATVVLRRSFHRRPAATIGQLFLFAATLGGIVLTAISGFFGPSRTGAFSEETHNRFVVLHMYFFPGLIGLLLLQWWWYFRPSRDLSG